MNTANINSNITEFKKIWEGLIHGIIAAASAQKNGYKADVAALTPFQNIYALMQCTPDISSGDCDNCLRQSVIDYQSCCGEKTGGYVMRPICFFRWQLLTFSKAFGNITLAPPSPPPSPPPLLQRQPSSASDQAKKTDTGKSLQSYIHKNLSKDSKFIWFILYLYRQQKYLTENYYSNSCCCYCIHHHYHYHYRRCFCSPVCSKGKIRPTS